MKAKTVESKLKEIVEKKFSGVSYVFDDWKAIDRKLSKVSLPAIICVMPISGVFTFNHGRVKDKPNCYIVFMDKVPKDADGDENEEIYSSMKEMAKKFISEVNKSGYFEAVEGDIPYDVITEKMSDILSGIGVPLSLKESAYNCV